MKDLYYAAKNGLVDLARTLLDSKTCEINACDHTVLNLLSLLFLFFEFTYFFFFYY